MSRPTFIKALNDFFSAEPHGKRISPTEFKELTPQDKLDLYQGLLAAGIDCDEPKVGVA